MMIQEVASTAGKNCSVCGTRRASALWMAFSGELLCCSHCAVKHLPQLIADAVVADQLADGAVVDPQALASSLSAQVDERLQRAAKHALARSHAVETSE